MPFLIRSLACIIAAGAFLAASPAEAQSQKPKPPAQKIQKKDPQQEEIERVRAWCRKASVGGAIRIVKRNGKWKCYYWG